ncbi:MAG: YcgN family cysteine cluster protein [Telmatospirillum sp.]|nr:YcgN family cysteine cluster protein [Telmatospirillum sp.]
MPDETTDATPPFWQTRTLAEMTPEEWESLCDGCGKCCLHKLQYEDTGELYYTNVACRLLDLGNCRCSRYETRQKLVPDCVALRADKVMELNWLPSTCAYRLLANGQPLAWWHPLVSGDPDSVHAAGQSVRGRAIPERKADILDHHIVTWPA